MTEPAHRTRLLAAALVTAAGLAAACGESPPRREAPARDTARLGSTSLPAARYVTLVAWTAAEGSPAGLLWMENATGDSVTLGRRYRGWTLTGEGARATLRVDDRFPVPSASWRPLPAPGLDLSVDARGRIASVVVRDGGSRLRLGRQLSSWRGATGQEQRLRRGALRTAGDTASLPVTAAVLRFEHLAGDPGPVGPARTLLLADGDGRGLLALDEGRRGAWNRGWAWEAGGDVRRLDPAALPDSLRDGELWVFRGAPGGNLPAEWRIAAPDTTPGAAGVASRGFRFLPVSARIEDGRGGRPARGFLLVAR